MRKRIALEVLRATGLLALLGSPLQAADLSEAGAPSLQTPPELAQPMDARSWFLHLGPVGVFHDESADVRVGGALVAGGDVSIDDDYTLGIEVGYFFTPNFALGFTGGFPPEAVINGAGSLAGTGRIGSAIYGPAILTAQYHVTQFGAFQPYIGAGPAYLIIFDTDDGAVSNFDVDNNFGLALQAGFDVMMGDRWGVFFDVKKLFLGTEARGTIGGAPVRADVTLDPLLVHAGLSVRF